MNLVAFIAADFLFLVIAYSMPVTTALGTAPIGGTPRIGPSTKSMASAITDIVIYLYVLSKNQERQWRDPLSDVVIRALEHLP